MAFPTHSFWAPTWGPCTAAPGHMFRSSLALMLTSYQAPAPFTWASHVAQHYPTVPLGCLLPRQDPEWFALTPRRACLAQKSCLCLKRGPVCICRDEACFCEGHEKWVLGNWLLLSPCSCQGLSVHFFIDLTLSFPGRWRMPSSLGRGWSRKRDGGGRCLHGIC